jgi:hypothetical protein
VILLGGSRLCAEHVFKISGDPRFTEKLTDVVGCT